MSNELIYEGTEAFLAVLCAEADRARILPWMEPLAAEGYRIWSAAESDGDPIGEDTARRIEKAEALLLILTPGAVRSRMFRTALNQAVLSGKRTYFYAEGSSDMLPLSMRMQLGVLGCTSVGQKEDPASAVQALRQVPEMERSLGAARPMKREEAPADVPGPADREDLRDPLTVTGNADGMDAEIGEDGTECVEGQPKPMLLFRLKDGKCYSLCAEKVRLGRSASVSDIAFGDNSRISGHHADLTQNDGAVYLTDAGSSNGTFLNGVRLQQGVPVRLPEHVFFQLFDDAFQLVYGLNAARLITDGYVLLLRNTATMEKRYVTEPEFLLGRKHPWPEGTMNDMNISREHAKIILVNGQPNLVDTGSYNGTYIDGRKLEPGQPEPLRDGMRITLGETDLACFMIPVPDGRDAV